MRRNNLLSIPLRLFLFNILVISNAFSDNFSGPVVKTPSWVVEAAYMAGNQANYSKTEQYFTADVLSAIKSPIGAAKGGLKTIWDTVTRNGTIERIEFLKEEVRGEGAKVFFRLHFKDGSTSDDHESLLMDGGKWKITGGQ